MRKDIEKMFQAFDEIQMARTPYMLEKMVVGSKFTKEQCYAQCVLELSVAYDNLRLAELHMKQKQLDIDILKKKKDKKSKLEIEIKKIEQDQIRRAMLGASREFSCLYELWQSFPKQYTREELNNAQPLEFKRRLELQALMDKNATGRVSVGNQEGLRQIGVTQFPELDYAREVDQRFLQEGDVKLSIVVPTEFKAENGLPCIEGLSLPAGVQVRIENCFGLSVAAAYNKLFQTAMDARSEYVLTVEDDTFPRSDALVKLYELVRANPKCAVGAWYPKKEKAHQGAHIILKDGKRQFLDNKVLGVHEVYTLSMGCTLYPIEMFKSIAYPWFKTTTNLSQDSFFSQLAREAGYKLLVDTNIKCEHRDRVTKEIFI